MNPAVAWRWLTRRPPGAHVAAPRGFVGRDLSAGRRPHAAGWRAGLPAAVAALVVLALAVVALRNDLIRMRYGLSEAMQQERRLLEERRALTAQVLALRDPARLTRLARERGFARPERVYEVPPPGGAAP